MTQAQWVQLCNEISYKLSDVDLGDPILDRWLYRFADGFAERIVEASTNDPEWPLQEVIYNMSPDGRS